MYFPKTVLEYRSLYAETQLLDLHMQAADQHLEILKQGDLIKEVRMHMASLLESGEITLDSVSALMSVSTRHLRHQLNVAGTSFQKILNDLRHRLALRLLSQTNEAINEIIYLTGFCEPSTFYRAFKRWEGTTPIDYRQRMRKQLK
ncbi:MAG: AraC family transcriptional regulator [Porticoccaceae bacterium]|nr:AraC family transcriptional regulator [Porticoccaceae bacterium]